MTMGVFRDLDIEWRGQVVTVTPSNRVLRRIEGQGISLVRMLQRVHEGNPPVSEICYVVSELLRTGGAEVTEDEVYQEAMAAMESDANALAKLAVTVAEAISPVQPDAGN